MTCRVPDGHWSSRRGTSVALPSPKCTPACEDDAYPTARRHRPHLIADDDARADAVTVGLAADQADDQPVIGRARSRSATARPARRAPARRHRAGRRRRNRPRRSRGAPPPRRPCPTPAVASRKRPCPSLTNRLLACFHPDGLEFADAIVGVGVRGEDVLPAVVVDVRRSRYTSLRLRPSACASPLDCVVSVKAPRPSLRKSGNVSPGERGQ